MTKQLTYHATAFGLAMAKAAGKVDHHWVARRVEYNILHRPTIGVKAEPATNAHLSLKTYNKLAKAGYMD